MSLSLLKIHLSFMYVPWEVDCKALLHSSVQQNSLWECSVVFLSNIVGVSHVSHEHLKCATATEELPFLILFNFN